MRHLRKARQSILLLNKSHVFLINSSNQYLQLKTYPMYHTKTTPCILQCKTLEFTTYGIQLLLERLEPTKAPGPDQIPTKVIKLCANAIAPVLQIIYTQSFKQATVPQEWLSANITPIFKKGNRITPANYRTISLTSVLSKVMEHIISHHYHVAFYITKPPEPFATWI